MILIALLLVMACEPDRDFGSLHRVCVGKSRRISCARGLATVDETMPGCRFSSRVPDFTYYLKDGTYHERYGNCDVSCMP